MKKYLLILTILLNFSAAFAQDTQDTLVFDLSQASEQSGYAEFPVYFLSDDTINAVDFSLRYNTVDLAYDSIIKLAGYLNITSNEVQGSTDTTVYFTSYSLQTITNDTPLVMIRFNLLTPGQICSEDLISVLGFLNGNAVSVKIVDCSTVGIGDEDENKDIMRIYPNPTAENTTIEFALTIKSHITISLHDITGKVVYEINPAEYSSGFHKINLNLSGLGNGVYVVRLNSDNETTPSRISVIH